MSEASSRREEAIEKAIAEYLIATESGAAFDTDAWLQRNADIADDLRDFVEVHEHAIGFVGAEENNAATVVPISV